MVAILWCNFWATMYAEKEAISKKGNQDKDREKNHTGPQGH